MEPSVAREGSLNYYYSMRRTAVLILLLMPLCAAGQSLVRQPYIQRLTPVSLTIAFKSGTSALGAVEYGSDESLGMTAAEESPRVLHGIDIDGLRPDTLYFYRVTLDGNPVTETLSFRTARDASVPIFSFNAVGDLGCGDLPAPQFGCSDIAYQWTRSSSDFGLILGDNVYDNGADADYDPKFFSNYCQFARTRCIYPAIGNHDTYSGSGQPFDDNFFNFDNNPELSERYYSFRYGNALFMALDPLTHGYGAGDPQTLWMIETLQSSDDLWKFAFFHNPPYSCCATRLPNLALRDAWAPIFELYGLDIAFTAHDHGYERTNVRKDYYPSASRGVVYYVSGGGGYYNYPWNTDCAWTAYGEQTYEFLRVEILGARARTCGVKTDGSAFDCTEYLKSDIPFDLFRGTSPSGLSLCQQDIILSCDIADGVPETGAVFYYLMDGPIIMHLEKNADGSVTTLSHQDFE